MPNEITGDKLLEVFERAKFEGNNQECMKHLKRYSLLSCVGEYVICQLNAVLHIVLKAI
jgi:hypothetical protein